MAFEKDDFFKVDIEMHIVGDMTPIEYFPGVQAWWRGIAGVTRQFLLGLKPEDMPTAEEITKREEPEAIIEWMDTYGVDVACIIPESMMDTTGDAARWVTNGAAAAVCERWPGRLVLTPNVGPVRLRGMKNVLWELEYLVKERNARMVKVYPPEDLPLNDPEMYPLYEKAGELDIPVAIHLGWCWVPPGVSYNCLPVLLDQVASDLPEVKFVAFHAGYPYFLDLALSAAVHPNIYFGLNLLVSWAANAPRRFGEIIGEALRWVGSERIVWGTDCAGFGAQVRGAVQGLREFQIPEDMQEGFGYPAITEQDRANIFGLNMAKLLKIEPARNV
ncbi:MAG: amidohydrolase [Actinobacteria bacterium]|nr:amidohydrolase [Actinomycetota bacterium]